MSDGNRRQRGSDSPSHIFKGTTSMEAPVAQEKQTIRVEEVSTLLLMRRAAAAEAKIVHHAARFHAEAGVEVGPETASAAVAAIAMATMLVGTAAVAPVTQRTDHADKKVPAVVARAEAKGEAGNVSEAGAAAVTEIAAIAIVSMDVEAVVAAGTTKTARAGGGAGAVVVTVAASPPVGVARALAASGAQVADTMMLEQRVTSGSLVLAGTTAEAGVEIVIEVTESMTTVTTVMITGTHLVSLSTKRQRLRAPRKCKVPPPKTTCLRPVRAIPLL